MTEAEVKTNKTKTNKVKIQKEVAKEQVQAFLDFYDIDFDFMSEDDEKECRVYIGCVEKAIVRGRLSISMADGELKVSQVPKHAGGNVPSKIVYGELSGRHKVEMSGGSSEAGSFHSRIYTLLGVMCGEGEDTIASMKGCDMSDAESLAKLFLLV